jgi:hypothetical protein
MHITGIIAVNRGGRRQEEHKLQRLVMILHVSENSCNVVVLCVFEREREREREMRRQTQYDFVRFREFMKTNFCNALLLLLLLRGARDGTVVVPLSC